MTSHYALPTVEKPPVAANPAGAPCPVLIVPPGHGAAATMAQKLAAAGWMTATTGHDHAIWPRHPAILILDAAGYDAQKRAAIARFRLSAPGTPALFLATREILEPLLAGGTLPGDDYILAPFNAGDVAMRLRWLTRHGSSAAKDPEISVGDLTLRPRLLVAQRAAHRIQLTKTQCAVLQLLMENAGIVVPKDEIANHVWPGKLDRGANNVELYISYLRRKINPAGPPMIHTLRSIGYLIKPAPSSPNSTTPRD